MDMTRDLVAFIRSHGVTCHPETDGTIRALEEYTLNGVPGSQWVTVQPDLSAVRDWLGY